MPGAQEKNKALVRRFYLDTLEELLAPDFVNHSLLPGQDPGREGYILSVTEAHLSRMFQGVHPKFIALRYGGDRRTREGGDVYRRIVRRLRSVPRDSGTPEGRF